MQVIDYHEAIFASKLSSHAKLTALIISSYYNWSKDQMCWPSNKTLSAGTSLSISSIVKAKKELVKEGYLLVHRRVDNSNLYRPLLPQRIPSVATAQRVCSNTPTNNEVNNEINNENVSNETLVSNILSAEEVESLLSW